MSSDFLIVFTITKAATINSLKALWGVGGGGG